MLVLKKGKIKRKISNQVIIGKQMQFGDLLYLKTSQNEYFNQLCWHLHQKYSFLRSKQDRYERKGKN